MQTKHASTKCLTGNDRDIQNYKTIYIYTYLYIAFSFKVIEHYILNNICPEQDETRVCGYISIYNLNI